jgi:hypothetical protein
MAENKTKATDASVAGFLAAIPDEGRREDCRALDRLMTRISQEKPKMWGAAIVGYGSYHYKYASGHEGDSCLVGFASRKSDITLYLVPGFPGCEELFAQLGRHKRGKGCLYVRKLADIDLAVLEKLIAGSLAERRRGEAVG